MSSLVRRIQRDANRFDPGDKRRGMRLGITNPTGKNKLAREERERKRAKAM